MLYFLLMSFCFILSWLATSLFIRYAKKSNLLDIPNERSSHTKVTPRGGGLVFIFIWLLFLIAATVGDFFSWSKFLVIVPGTVIVALTGFLDDHYSLKPSYRAMAYFLAGFLVILAIQGLPQIHLNGNIVLPLGWLGGILAIFMIVWSTNLFNFMDGIDGIAAIEALFILGFGGYFLWLSGGKDLAFSSWLLAAGVLAFLLWNFPPAKLFMGDVGSAALGFIIMVLAILGEKYFDIPLLLWFILYGVFLVDTSMTLFRRMLAKEAWYLPHRSHAYQRLHQLGFSHASILAKVIMVNAILAGLAIFGFYHKNYILPLFLIAMLMLLLLYYKIERMKPMFSPKPRSVSIG